MKYSKVLELPEVLCVHLKRFRHELMFSSKINNYVTFPLTDLDLKPYLHKGESETAANTILISSAGVLKSKFKNMNHNLIKFV